MNVNSLAAMQAMANFVAADVNKPTDDGLTPAMVAAYEGQLDVMELLKGVGADLDAKARDGRSALHVAVVGNQPVGMKRVPESTNRSRFPLLPAASQVEGQIDIVRWLVTDCKMDPSDRDKKGKAPIELAEEHGRKQVFRYLHKQLNPRVSDKQVGPSSLCARSVGALTRGGLN